MAAGAHIRIDQATNPVPTGTYDQGRDDVRQSVQVQLVGDANSGGNVSPQWTLLDKPAGATASLTGGSTFTPTVTGDKPGPYRVQLLVNDGLAANAQIKVFRVTCDANGNLIDDGICPPAYGELSTEGNAGGNLRGYGPLYEAMLAATVPAISTVAALRTRVPSRHKRIRVLAFAILGDGGEGDFAWVTVDSAHPLPADDGGINILATGITSGWWKRQYAGAISGAWFGMRADGTGLTNVGVTASSSTIACTSLVATDVGKAIQIQCRNTPASGTVATIVASAITGTVTTVADSATITMTDSTEVYIGQTVVVGGRVMWVRSKPDATHAVMSFKFAASTGGVAMTRYGIFGTGTSFLSQLTVGQAIYVGGTLCNVVAVADDTHAAVWPLPTGSPTSGLTLYRKHSISAFLATVTPGVGGTLSSMTGTVANNETGCSAIYGTDNTPPYLLARAAAITAKRILDIAGSTKRYCFGTAMTDIGSNSAAGLRHVGHGAGILADSYLGSPAWLSSAGSDSQGTHLQFLQGNGFLTDALGATSGLKYEDMALIGSGAITSTGFGVNPTGTHALDGSIGGFTSRSVTLCNWGTGYFALNNFNWNFTDVYAIGCGIGMNAGGNAGVWTNPQFNGCMIGLYLTSGAATQVFNASSFQGNILWGTLIAPAAAGDVEVISFHGGYWENQTGNPLDSLCGSIHMSSPVTATIQHIAFYDCHATDSYSFDPINNGTITAIVTKNCRFTAKVSPRWSSWNELNGDANTSWGAIDWTAYLDITTVLGTSKVGTTYIDAGSAFAFRINGVEKLNVDSQMYWLFTRIGAHPSAGDNTIGQLTTGGALGSKTTIQAQDAAGGSATGGALDIRPGTGTATGGRARLIKAGGTAMFTWDDTGLSFYGAATIAQPTRAGQLTGAFGSTGTAIVDCGAAYSQTNCNNNIRALEDKINALELILHNLGLST